MTGAERAALVEAFSRALSDIPVIRRSLVGRRTTHGRPYEQLMRENYDYAAILEFDDMASLKAYLDHPAHEELAARFFASFESALMYDYEMSEGEAGLSSIG